MTATEHTVVIVGAGPTGTMLGAELRLAGVDVAIVERRTSDELLGSRSGGLHARTIEVLDQRGIVDRFLTAGHIAQVAGFATIGLDISDFPTRHPYGLALWQNTFEDILAAWADELEVPVQRGCAVVALDQDDDGVTAQLSDGTTLRSGYLVGCDGGRSVVRKSAGIDFPGWEPTVSFLVAEVQMSEEPELGLRRDEKGVHALGRLDDGRIRLVLREDELRRGDDPTLADLRRQLIAVRGTDYGAHSPTWISRFTDMTRQAASYRNGRILLAGDAAHIHPPIGGQGLQLGVQDAVNLGWKLAQVATGRSPASLLDTYHAERHPVAARVLRMTMAQTALMPSTDRLDALREALAELLSIDEPRRRFAGMMSGLDIHYDLGEGHPLLGRRMPDLDLATAAGVTRVYSLLHDARPLLIDLAVDPSVDVAGWADRVRRVEARYDGSWDLPVLGGVDAPTAVLVRPDGYVAWVGQGGDAGVRDALTTWFGAARS